MTFLFWFLPSLLWKKSVAGSQSKEERLAELSQDLDTAQERVTGVYHSLVESGAGDLYNRLLCPTCIAQIVTINTMVVSQHQHSMFISIISLFSVSCSNDILEHYLCSTINFAFWMNKNCIHVLIENDYLSFINISAVTKAASKELIHLDYQSVADTVTAWTCGTLPASRVPLPSLLFIRPGLLLRSVALTTRFLPPRI